MAVFRIVKQYLDFGSKFADGLYGSPFNNGSTWQAARLFWLAKNRKMIETDFNVYHFWRGYFHGDITCNIFSYYGMSIKKNDKKFFERYNLPHEIINFIQTSLEYNIILQFSEVMLKYLISKKINGLVKCKIPDLPVDVREFECEAIKYENFEYLDKCKLNNTIKYQISTKTMVEYFKKRNLTNFIIDNPELAVEYGKYDDYIKNNRSSYDKILAIAKFIDTSHINNRNIYEKVCYDLNDTEIVHLVKLLNVNL